MVKKSRLFVENMLIYGFGGIISKIIPFIMIPIITRMMPNTEYYGLSDMSNTLISMASVLAVLGMYDGLFRLFFEKEDIEYKKGICSTALLFSLGFSTLVSIIMFIFRIPIARIFFKDKQYDYLVTIAALTIAFGATNQIIAAPTRMQNKKILYIVINCVSPIISYTLAIILLLKENYTTALPIATLITGILTEVTYFAINRKWFRFRRFDIKLLKEMLIIGLPLVPNFLIYWVFNSCDKLMITRTLGLGEAGVYSIGSKLGHCSQLIYTAFAGGWSYFVFSTMKDQNQIEYNSKLFEILAIISFSSSAFICVIAKYLYMLLFPEEYVSGFVVAPYLFLCPLLLMLFQLSASQFIVVKKTWYNTAVLFGGAIINVILNEVLISKIGIEGAAIATLAGYSISLIICLVILQSNNLFIISNRLLIYIIAMALYFILWRFLTLDSLLCSIIIFAVFIIFTVLLYRKEFKTIKTKIIGKYRKSERIT